MKVYDVATQLQASAPVNTSKHSSKVLEIYEALVSLDVDVSGGGVAAL